MVRAGSGRLCMFTLAVCVAVVASPGWAAPIILKQGAGEGYINASTYDALLKSYATGDRQSNFGGMAVMDYFYGATDLGLFKFDLDAIPDKDLVTGVTSATLRVYRTGYAFSSKNYKVAQLAQDWVEGNSPTPNICDGAQWFNRNAGTIIAKSTYVNNGDGTWYIAGVTDLGDDPINTGKKHVRPAIDKSNIGNGQSVYTNCTTLDALKLLNPATTRGYYWDEATGRLYLNKNDYDVRYYKSTDHWTTPGGTTTGSYINAPTSPSSPATWIEFNVTSIVQNWLLNGQDNYGFKMLEMSNGGGKFATSENGDVTLRPELVLDLVVAPEPATLALLALAGLGLVRRRNA